MAALEDVYKTVPHWKKATDAKLEARVPARQGEAGGLRRRSPPDLGQVSREDKTVPARYARAYAWHKSGYPEKANAEVEACSRSSRKDPYFLELKGQILLESGKPKEALQSLRQAVALAPTSRSSPRCSAMR
jgi:predicted Zn-dependent protease